MSAQTDQAVRISSTSRRGFFRCGRGFPFEGVVLSRSEFSEAEWDILSQEPNLRITPADEMPEADAQARHDAIWGAIQVLPPDGFQKDGKPRLDAINAALEGAIDSKVGAAERDAIWAEMTETGFEAPKAPD